MYILTGLKLLFDTLIVPGLLVVFVACQYKSFVTVLVVPFALNLVVLTCVLWYPFIVILEGEAFTDKLLTLLAGITYSSSTFALTLKLTFPAVWSGIYDPSTFQLQPLCALLYSGRWLLAPWKCKF